MKAEEVKMVYSTRVKPQDRKVINSSGTAVDIIRPYYNDYIEYKEVAYVLLLNKGNQVLGINRISEGGVSGTVVDVKLILQACLLCNASAFILVHNHPSGNLQPSEADKTINIKLKKAGATMDLEILDSIIITKYGYWSAADEGGIQ